MQGIVQVADMQKADNRKTRLIFSGDEAFLPCHDTNFWNIDITIYLLPRFKFSNIQPLFVTVRFVSCLVGNPKIRFYLDAARIVLFLYPNFHAD